MAELPLDEAIPRFKANENRIDQFTNGDDTTVWVPSGENTTPLPSLAKFLKDKESEIDTAIAYTTIVTQATAAANAAEASADASQTSATAAQGFANAAEAAVDDVEEALASGGSFAAWTSAVTRTMKQRSKFICHIADFASPSSTVDRTTEILAWAQEGQSGGARLVFGSDGGNEIADYITQQEIEITKQGQVIEFQQYGGFGDVEPDVGSWMPRIRLRAAGGVSGWFNTTGKRVRTRRLFRGSAGDPQDATMSALINVQAEGVQLIKPSLWLNCDYTNLSPTNLGDYCDVGIFIGCRAAVQIHDPQIIGYFRRAGIYFDVTFDNELVRHLGKDGNPYPMGVPRNGADTSHLYNPYIRGSRVGLAILGALPKAGQTGYSDPYYDQQLGATVADSRGSSGFSDFLCLGGTIYGPEHHSDRRLANPTLSGGVLNQTSLEAEPDTMPACVHIDGLAGNASGNIWGHRFIGTRIATFEAFRVRLNRSSRDEFIGCHIEGRNSGARMNTGGGVIDSNNYTTTSYGDISGTSVTDRTTIFGNVRSAFADGMAPHYYGPLKPFYVTDGGRVNIPDFLINEAGEMDVRGGTGFGVRFRSGVSTIGTVNENGVASFTRGVMLPGYTAANIASIAHAVNTTGKATGLLVRDTTNNRVMMARGSTAGSVWDVVDGSASVTPV